MWRSLGGRIRAWGVVLGVAAGAGLSAGCSGESVEPLEGAAGTGGSTSKGETTPNEGSIPNAYAEQCNATGGDELTFADKDDATEKLAGRWVLCSGPGLVFATEQPRQAGLELTPDLRWFALEPSEEGLARASGFQASGSWRFQPPQDLDYSPATTALLFMGADYSFVTVSMLDAPRKTRWTYSTFGGEASIYAYIGP